MQIYLVEMAKETLIILLLGFMWKQQLSVISLSTSHSEVDIAIPAIYCLKTVANLLRGPPGIGD